MWCRGITKLRGLWWLSCAFGFALSPHAEAQSGSRIEIVAQTAHSRITATAFLPGAEYVISAGGMDGTVKLWQVGTGRLVRNFASYPSHVEAAAISPDGNHLITTNDYTREYVLKLWDVHTGRELRTFTGHSSHIRAVAYSPDGHHVISGSWDKTLKLWDVGTGSLVRTLFGHGNYVTAVAFSPDGRHVLSGSADNTLKLWNVETGTEVRT
jgi:WD40 repeat protein